MADHLLGVDIGGTSLKCVRVDAATGETLQRWRVPTQPLRQAGFATAFADYLGGLEPIAGVGLGVPGMLSPDQRGCVQVDTLPSLNGFALADALQRRLGSAFAKTPRVRLANDASCAALGLRALAPELPASFLLVGLGTGVGGALVQDGRLFVGPQGNALEPGYQLLPGGGFLEGEFGVAGLLRRFRENGVEVPAARLRERLDTADEVAVRVRGELRAALAWTLNALVLALDVRAIVLGGGNAPSTPDFYAELTRELRATLPAYYAEVAVRPVPDVPHAAYAAALGAAELVRRSR